MSLSTNEATLIRRAQTGDRAALASLHDQHYRAIYTYFSLRVNDPDLAEDLTADVFVRMVQKIGTFRPRKRPFLAWLYTIARNLLTDYYRAQQKEAGNMPLDEALVSGGDDPARQAEKRLAADCLRTALRHLTEEQQQVVVGKFIEGRSNLEMAHILEKTEGAVKSLQHRALAALRRAIAKEGCYEA